jgi:small subunit ribosomal protein S3
MGQKIPAKANRLGVRLKRTEEDNQLRIAAEPDAQWYEGFGGRKFARALERDHVIRQLIEKVYGKKVGISRVHISRKDEQVEIQIYSLRPATILGKDNQKVDKLRDLIRKHTGERAKVTVLEASPGEAQIIADKIASDLERRMSFRRAAKTAISKAMGGSDIKGIKVQVSGRLGGAEIARTERFQEGTVPLHTWYANITNALALAVTTYGIIGVQVVLHRSVFPAKKEASRGKSAR